MAGPEKRGGRGAGGSGEAQAQGQPRDSAMAPVQPSLGPPRDEPRVFGLDKFNGDNFAEWSFRMENVLDHYELLEVMEGMEKRPENDPEKSPWVRKSGQGYLLLGQALGSSQIRHIKPFRREPEKEPKAWAALKGVHATATAVVAVVLERQMATLRIEEDEAVEEGVQKFFDLLTRLEGAYLNYSELQKKTKLLALLPESWSSLIIDLNRDLPRLSLEDVNRAILEDDFRRRELVSADGAGAASIGRGYGRERGQGRGGGRFGSIYFNGGRGSGGYGSDNKSYGRGRSRFDGECHYCHKSVHVWRDCFRLPNGWTPAQGQEGRGAGGGRGRGRGGRGGCGGGAANTKNGDNESESRDDRFRASISTKGEVVGSGDGANGCAKEIESKKYNLGGTSKLSEHKESGVAAQKQHKGEENPKAAAQEEYGENMWGTIASAAFSNPTSATGECDWLTLHRRMGHVALPILQLVKNEMVAGIRLKEEPDEVLGCPTCMQAKFTRYPFSSSEATVKAPLDEVVMDVVGPLKLGAAGEENFLTIVDVYTCMTWVYVLSKKSDVAEMVKTDWLPIVEWQQDRLKNGIRHSLAMPYSPAMNDIAERANRTITETARRLLIEAGLPDYFWPDAVRKNLMYKDWKAENEAKIGMLFGEVKSSGLEHVELPLDMSSGSTTTRQSSLVNGGEEAKDAEEEEELQQVSERALTLPSRTTSAPRIRVTPQQRHESLHVPAAEEEGRGKRRIQAPNRLTYEALGKPAKSALAKAAMMVGDDKESEYEEFAFAFFSPVEMPGEPATLKEALESSDAEDWKKAMESELKGIEENGMWEWVELPEGRKAITSKWLFKIKSDTNGRIEHYKSRLVAKGYQQKEKVEYKELYAPVVRPTTLQTLLGGAAIKGWVVKQMDVTTTFLNGILEEEIFMVTSADDGAAS
ncbi:unnamed protein product [Closterium sp. NIES-54]